MILLTMTIMSSYVALECWWVKQRNILRCDTSLFYTVTFAQNSCAYNIMCVCVCARKWRPPRLCNAYPTISLQICSKRAAVLYYYFIQIIQMNNCVLYRERCGRSDRLLPVGDTKRHVPGGRSRDSDESGHVRADEVRQMREGGSR